MSEDRLHPARRRASCGSWRQVLCGAIRRCPHGARGELGPRRNSPDVHRAVCVCHVDAPSGALRCVCRIDTHTHTHTYIVYTAIIYNYISIHYSSI